MIDNIVFNYVFPDYFECALDKEGIIYIKHKEDTDFQRFCMKLCYDLIKLRNPRIAKYVLNKSCEIQNDDAITKRAEGYE